MGPSLLLARSIVRLHFSDPLTPAIIQGLFFLASSPPTHAFSVSRAGMLTALSYFQCIAFLDALDGSYCTYSAYGETGNCNNTACQDPEYPDTQGNGNGGYEGQLQCGVYSPTNVISISYSFPEFILPAYYMERQCNEWMKLGLQGVTVVVAAGDSGVGPDGNCEGSQYDIFTPYYLSTCPYVLSVGATELDLPSGQTTPTANEKLYERGTTGFSSGGGFSNVFDQPSYQQTAVQNYFDSVDLPFTGYTESVNGSDFSNVTSGLYRTSGRGYPDVSAVGDRFPITYDGSWTVVGGTSAATPIWAAIITLINEGRLAAGKATVGFINPTLVSPLTYPVWSHLPPFSLYSALFYPTERISYSEINLYDSLAVCQPSVVQRHNCRQQSGVRYYRLPGCRGVGSRHWTRVSTLLCSYTRTRPRFTDG